MVQLKGKTALVSGVEPSEGEYTVLDTKEVKTDVQGFSGIRVILKSIKPNDTTEYATMLWKRETAGIRSKLGSFLDAFTAFFGDEDMALETDNWKGHRIRLVSWAPKKREVVVLE